MRDLQGFPQLVHLVAVAAFDLSQLGGQGAHHTARFIGIAPTGRCGGQSRSMTPAMREALQERDQRAGFMLMRDAGD